MKVVWKRPDGFHGASPTDFKVVELDGHSKIWLHKSNHDWFPFRIAGDWDEEEATQKLNRLVNLLDSDQNQWVKFLSENFATEFTTSNGLIVDIPHFQNLFYGNASLNVLGHHIEICNQL